MATHNPTTAAAIITAINDAASGDTVNLPEGTYDCSGTDLAPSAGVTITGQGMGRTIIKSRLNVAGGGSSDVLTLQDWTLSCDGLEKLIYGPAELANVVVRGYRWRVTDCDGAAAQNALTAVASGGHTYDVQLWDCEIDTCTADCVSSKDGGAGDTDSVFRLYRCAIHGTGTGASDQCVTGHGGLIIECYGCRLYGVNSSSKMAMLDDGNSPGVAVGCVVTGGRVQGRIVNHNVIDGGGGYWGIVLTGANPQAIGNRISNVIGGATEAVIYSTGGAGSTGTIESNLILGAPGVTGVTAIMLPSASVAGTFAIRNNTILDVKRGIDSRGGAGLTATTITNNAVRVTTESGAYAILGDSGTKVTGGSNTSNGSNFNFTGTGDTSAAPALDGHYRPTPGGNCDGNGDATTLGSTVDADRHPRGATGFLVSRGALERDWNLNKTVPPAPHVLMP